MQEIFIGATVLPSAKFQHAPSIGRTSSTGFQRSESNASKSSIQRYGTGRLILNLACAYVWRAHMLGSGQSVMSSTLNLLQEQDFPTKTSKVLSLPPPNSPFLPASFSFSPSSVKNCCIKPHRRPSLQRIPSVSRSSSSALQRVSSTGSGNSNFQRAPSFGRVGSSDGHLIDFNTLAAVGKIWQVI